MKKKKGQLSIGDAPNVVLVIGLVFLTMATIAFISEVNTVKIVRCPAYLICP